MKEQEAEENGKGACNIWAVSTGDPDPKTIPKP